MSNITRKRKLPIDTSSFNRDSEEFEDGDFGNNSIRIGKEIEKHRKHFSDKYVNLEKPVFEEISILLEEKKEILLNILEEMGLSENISLSIWEKCVIEYIKKYRDSTVGIKQKTSPVEIPRKLSSKYIMRKRNI